MTKEEIISAAPSAPGCYLFKDQFAHVIYVGKAKNIQSRVRSYFRLPPKERDRGKNKQGSKLAGLLAHISQAEFRIAGTELEALFLEYHLIKTYKPLYNSQLKSSAEHPWLRISADAEYPSLSISAEKKEDGAAYYGCFYDRYDAEAALALLNKAWRTPVCGKERFTGNTKKCLYYHLGGCAAPCEKMIHAEDYRRTIAEIRSFLGHEPTGVIPRLRENMAAAAEQRAFEKAEEIRALIERLEGLQKKAGKFYDLKAVKRLVLFIRPYRAGEYSIFYLCCGEIHFRFDSAEGDSGIESFIASYRERGGGGTNAAPETPWLAGALAEIFADKFFLVLPDEPGEEDARLIRGAFSQFITAS